MANWCTSGETGHAEICAAYKDILAGRLPDLMGANYWLDRLLSGAQSISEIRATMGVGLEARAIAELGGVGYNPAKVDPNDIGLSLTAFTYSNSPITIPGVGVDIILPDMGNLSPDAIAQQIAQRVQTATGAPPTAEQGAAIDRAVIDRVIVQIQLSYK
jgi:hypothetical protein